MKPSKLAVLEQPTRQYTVQAQIAKVILICVSPYHLRTNTTLIRFCARLGQVVVSGTPKVRNNILTCYPLD